MYHQWRSILGIAVLCFSHVCLTKSASLELDKDSRLDLDNEIDRLVKEISAHQNEEAESQQAFGRGPVSRFSGDVYYRPESVEREGEPVILRESQEERPRDKKPSIHLPREHPGEHPEHHGHAEQEHKERLGAHKPSHFKATVSQQEHEPEKPQKGQKEQVEYPGEVSRNQHHRGRNGTGRQAAPAAMRLRENEKRSQASMGDVYFLAIVAGCSVAGLIGLIFAGVCWYKLQKNVKAASEAEYPAYGVTGPNKERVGSPGDRKLAQSAQMYHYQHQKQQMIAMEKANGEMKHDGSDEDSEEENEEGDYTVYECPGLAPTGEMEVKNPLFSEDMTPATPATPATPGKRDERDEK